MEREIYIIHKQKFIVCCIALFNSQFYKTTLSVYKSLILQDVRALRFGLSYFPFKMFEWSILLPLMEWLYNALWRCFDININLIPMKISETRNLHFPLADPGNVVLDGVHLCITIKKHFVYLISILQSINGCYITNKVVNVH